MTADAAPHQPHDGEVGHLTIRATYRSARVDAPASYAIEAAAITGDGEWTWIAAEEWLGHRTSGVVDFRPLPLPPLPTEFGSLILAVVGPGSGCPVLLTLGSASDEPTWFIAGAQPFQAAHVEDIRPGWVQTATGHPAARGGDRVSGPKPDQVRLTLAAMLREEYDGGSSIRDLAVKYGCCLSTVHKMLRDVGTELRGPGWPLGKPRIPEQREETA